MTEDDISPFETFREYFDSNGSLGADDSDAIVTRGAVAVKKGVRFPKGKLPVRFAETGTFEVVMAGLKTLEGCPRDVRGNFDASLNPIDSLEGGPVSVGDAYNVSNCKNLTSLRGAPQFVNNAFIATQCNLSHFHELAHSKIDRLVLTQNPITSLLGIPTNCYNLRVDYHAQLPLLRVVLPNFPKLILRPPTSDQEDAVEYVRALIFFYWNKGIAAAVPMARELIRMGLRGNAVWEKDLP